MKRKTFHKVWLATVGVVATLLIFLAVVLSLLRGVVGQVPEYRADLEQWLSHTLGQQVQINQVDAMMAGHRLIVTLQGARILDSGRKGVLFDLDELRLGINLVNSLLRQQMDIEFVELSGAMVTLERMPDGQLKIQGGVLSSLGGQDETAVGFSESESRAWVERLHGWQSRLPRQIMISRGSLFFRDHVVGKDYSFHGVNMLLNNDAQHSALAGAFSLDPALGDRMRFRVEYAVTTEDRAENTIGDIRFYLQGNRLKLHHWPWEIPVENLPRVEGGELDLQVWSDWREGQLTEIQTRFYGRDVQLLQPDVQPDTAHYSFDRIEGALGYQADSNGWVAKLGEWGVEWEGVRWETGALTVWKTALADPPYAVRYGVSSDFLRVQDGIRLAALVPVDKGEGWKALEKWQPSGDVQDLFLMVEREGQKINELIYDVSIPSFSFAAEDLSVSVQNIHARLMGNGSKGVLRLDGKEGEVSFLPLFRGSLPFKQIQGEVVWSRDEQFWKWASQQVEIETPDLRATLDSHGLTTSALAQTQMDLRVRTGSIALAKIPEYFPVGIMPPLTLSWLEDAFRDGAVKEADLIFSGALNAFPFEKNEGVFTVQAEVEGASLFYQRNWPELTDLSGTLLFTGQGMKVLIDQGQYGAFRVESGQVTIQDYENPVLEVNAKGSGSSESVGEYLRETPLEFVQNTLFRSMMLSGQSQLELSLKLPLDSRIPEKEEVDGVLRLENNSLQQTRLKLQAESVSGFLVFDEQSIVSGKMEGRLFGRPFSAEVEPTEEEKRRAGRETRIRAKAFLEPLWYFQGESLPPLSDAVSGLSEWDLLFRVIPLNKRASRVIVDGKSTLEGVSIDFPSPFSGLAAETIKPLSFRLDFIDNDMALLDLSWASKFKGQLSLDLENTIQVNRGHIRFGMGKVPLPDRQVIKLSGQPGVVDLDGWSALVSGLFSGQDEVSEALAFELDLYLEKLLWQARAFENLSISMSPLGKGYEISLMGKAIQGQIRLPWPDFAAGPLEVNLQHFHYMPLAKDALEKSRPFAFDGLPEIRLIVKEFFYRGESLGELAVVTQPMAGGMEIERVNFKGKNFSLRTNGSWLTKEGFSQTRLQGEFEGNQLHSLYEKLGLATNLSADRMKSSFEVGWQGSPLDAQLQTLSGVLEMTLENGRLSSVEPGAGRFLGLLSLNQLVRRVSFDFSDLVGEGLPFDRAQAYIVSESGLAEIKDLYIDGPLAFIDINGKVGMADQSYDLMVTVTPKTSDTLPLLGGLVAGNPAVGLSIMVFQRLFRKQLDQLTQYRYHVTGKWEDPVLTKVVIQPESQVNPVIDDLIR